MYNELGSGSYLDWVLYPQTQVFIDPRIELYPLAFWQDYLAIGRGENSMALLEGKYAVSCVLLNANLQPHLAAAIRADGDWIQTFPTSLVSYNDPIQVWRRQ